MERTRVCGRCGLSALCVAAALLLARSQQPHQVAARKPVRSASQLVGLASPRRQLDNLTASHRHKHFAPSALHVAARFAPPRRCVWHRRAWAGRGCNLFQQTHQQKKTHQQTPRTRIHLPHAAARRRSLPLCPAARWTRRHRVARSAQLAQLAQRRGRCADRPHLAQQLHSATSQRHARARSPKPSLPFRKGPRATPWAARLQAAGSTRLATARNQCVRPHPCSPELLCLPPFLRYPCKPRGLTRKAAPPLQSLGPVSPVKALALFALCPGPAPLLTSLPSLQRLAVFLKVAIRGLLPPLLPME
eukprot:m.63209 g.63209  ORF g.63209 m.63209 type:complete len:304 (-) comp7443_c0_seq3:30-941(-)